MIVGLCRLVAAVAGWLLLVLLALLGVVAAVLAIQSGTATLSYANGADLAGLPAFRETVDGWLRAMEDGGATDTTSLLAGLGAVALGLALLTGALVARRDRLVVVERRDSGTLAVRRRAAAGALAATLERPHDVLRARAAVRARRRGVGGRARTRLDTAQTADGDTLVRQARSDAEGLAGDLGLKLRVRTRETGRVR